MIPTSRKTAGFSFAGIKQMRSRQINIISNLYYLITGISLGFFIRKS
jgi:hypothetical protein